MNTIFKVTSILFLLLSFGFSEEYKFLSGSPGGNWDTLGKEISSLFTQNGINTKSSKGGGFSNITNIDNNGADIGFSVGSLVGAATKGDEVFSKTAINIEVLANLYPQVTYFIARKDFVIQNNIKTLKDALNCKNLKLGTLKQGTSSYFVINSLFKLGYNTSISNLKNTSTTYKKGKKLLAENKINMFAFSVGENASIVKDIEDSINVMILPVDKKALIKLSSQYGTKTYILRPKFFKSVSKFTPTIGDSTVLIVKRGLPEDTIRNMAKILLNNKEQLTQKVKDFSRFNARNAITRALPMNKIAQVYFKSRKWFVWGYLGDRV